MLRNKTTFTHQVLITAFISNHRWVWHPGTPCFSCVQILSADTSPSVSGKWSSTRRRCATYCCRVRPIKNISISTVIPQCLGYSGTKPSSSAHASAPKAWTSAASVLLSECPRWRSVAEQAAPVPGATGPLNVDLTSVISLQLNNGTMPAPDVSLPSKARADLPAAAEGYGVRWA